MDNANKQSSPQDIIANILAYRPALRADFYQEGEMECLKQHDALNPSANHLPNQGSDLADLPVRFQEQLNKLSQAMAFLKEGQEISERDSAYSLTDDIETTIEKAANKVESKTPESQEWKNYTNVRGTIIRSLSNLMRNASIAESMLKDRRDGKPITPMVPSSHLAQEFARNLFEASMREAGIATPTIPF